KKQSLFQPLVSQFNEEPTVHGGSSLTIKYESDCNSECLSKPNRSLQSQQTNCLVPRSHKFQAQFFLSLKSNKNRGFQRELPLTGTSQQTTRSQGGFSSG